MYKKQMVFQRIICYAVLVASALVFVYSLGLMTDLYDSLYSTIRSASNLDMTTVTGSRIFYDMQPFNSSLTKVGIGLILVSLVLFLMNTHSRRKYYIGNFIAVALSVVCNIAATVWAVIEISAYRQSFLQIDFEALKAHAESRKTLYTESTFWFDAGYVVFGILMIATALLVVNLILKLNVMKDEKRLIGSRKEVEA
ncbi:MAG: hypothetical protein NC123_15215 [Butyrivibrio sp.]|nr:hypothetical protein [Acetatifactor muris]MCM1560870.1 hypothetical protein [Butyrivibrio sp.]